MVLYFNEGAGCDACFYQMREFGQHAMTGRRAPRAIRRPLMASDGSEQLQEISGSKFLHVIAAHRLSPGAMAGPGLDFFISVDLTELSYRPNEAQPLSLTLP